MISSVKRRESQFCVCRFNNIASYCIGSVGEEEKKEHVIRRGKESLGRTHGGVPPQFPHVGIQPHTGSKRTYNEGIQTELNHRRADVVDAVLCAWRRYSTVTTPPFTFPWIGKTLFPPSFFLSSLLSSLSLFLSVSVRWMAVDNVHRVDLLSNRSSAPQSRLLYIDTPYCIAFRRGVQS